MPILFFSSCKEKEPMFTLLSSKKTNIHFSNNLQDTGGINFLDYLYYYNGGGVAAGDINNDGLTDIYFTANKKGGNKLYLNKGDFVFEDITDKAAVQGISNWSSGVTMADVNADGLLDIYVCAVAGKLGLEGHNQLFINKGNNRFADESEGYGLNFSGFSTQAAFFDYDKDGDLDCYLLNQSMHSQETYGDTSIRRLNSPLAGDRLYKNNSGTFINVSAEAGIYSSPLGYGLGIAIADLNDDGWDDIYVGNDFHENDYYYVNNGNGTFTESGAKHFGHYSRFSMGNDIADYNNDGQLDIFTTDMLPQKEEIIKTYASEEQPDVYDFKIKRNGFQNQYSHNCLQKNMGDGSRFSEVAYASNVAATDWSWSPLLADFNNDGLKDLFVTSGIVKRPADLDYIRFISDVNVKMKLNDSRSADAEVLNNMPSGKSANFIFEGAASGIFKDQSINWGFKKEGFSNGAAYADLNNDGALDLIINHINEEASVYKNNISAAKYFSIDLKGMPGNSFGIGAKVYLFTAQGLQFQQLFTTRGFQSSVEPRLHFGLDTLTHIDSVLIVWPDQKYQLLKNIPCNQLYKADYKKAAGLFNKELFFQPAKEIFQNITEVSGIDFTHKENAFLDFSNQYFIPHKQSTLGPKLAVADVNNDGLEDFFVCASKNDRAKLFLQTKDSRFVQSTIAAIKDSVCEQTDALFVDVDGDGDKDLYVVSGGNEEDGTLPSLADHLYINNGKGVFAEEKKLPPFFGNKSSVCAADIDADGDQDIFVAGHTVAKSYGEIPASFLLINDGKGNFSLDGSKWGKLLQRPGLISDASFADMNNDKKPDLVVAGEWMPVTIFINTGNGFAIKFADKNKTTGCWQTVFVSDMNNDGFADIVAGNYGINSRLKATENGPVKLYLKDIDGNGQTDPILTTTDGATGKEYPFLLKDELERQLPYLKKQFLYYKDFAGKTVSEIWPSNFKDADVLTAQTMQSMIFINDQKGGFTATALPLQMQMGPLLSISKLPGLLPAEQSIIYAGNFFGSLPFEGNYDALMPGLYNYSTKKITNTALLNSIPGEIRDVKAIRLANEKRGILVAGNNQKLILLQY